MTQTNVALLKKLLDLTERAARLSAAGHGDTLQHEALRLEAWELRREVEARLEASGDCTELPE